MSVILRWMTLGARFTGLFTIEWRWWILFCVISTVFSAGKCIRKKGRHWLTPRGFIVDSRFIYKQQLLFPGIQRAQKESIHHPSKDLSCHPPGFPSLKLQFILDFSLPHPTHLISYKSFVDKICISKPRTCAYFRALPFHHQSLSFNSAPPPIPPPPVHLSTN